jgi:hypothetical protein
MCSLIENDKWLRHLVNVKEVIDNKMAPPAFEYFKLGKCGFLAISGKSCKKAKASFHQKANEKANEKSSFRYLGFLVVDFCENCVIKETIRGTEYIFMCFYTPRPRDETHCDLFLVNKSSLSFGDRVNLSEYSQTFKIMKPTADILCC